MNKVIIIVLIVLVLAGGGFFYMKYMGGGLDFSGFLNSNTVALTNTSKPDLQNIKYTIDGAEVGPLDGGVSVGTPTYGDIDQDGDQDGAVWYRKDLSESEKVYYAAIVINESQKNNESGVTKEVKAPNAVLLGDNILPQSIEVKNGQTVYTFLDQVPNTSPSSTPTVSQSVAVDYDTNSGNLVVVEIPPTPVPPQNMTLDMKQWKWVQTTGQSGVTYPSAPEGFTVTLQSSGVFNATADCNVVGGVYTTTGSSIEFSQMKGTGLSCSRSNESVFWSIFENAESYSFNASSELIFNLGNNSTAVFK